MTVKISKDTLRQNSLKYLVVLTFIGLLLLIFNPLGLFGVKPEQVRVANLNDRSFTISWVTARPEAGVVLYGARKNYLPGVFSDLWANKAYDDRDIAQAQLERYREVIESAEYSSGAIDIDPTDLDLTKYKVKKVKYYTHSVTIGGLDPETDYYFKVGNGFYYWSDGVMKLTLQSPNYPYAKQFKVTTLEELEELKQPNPSYGRVVKAEDDGLAPDYLVYSYIKDGDEGIPMTNLMSSVVNDSGGYYIDLANAKAPIEGVKLDFGDETDFIQNFKVVGYGVDQESKATLDQNAPVDDIKVAPASVSEEIDSPFLIDVLAECTDEYCTPNGKWCEKHGGDGTDGLSGSNCPWGPGSFCKSYNEAGGGKDHGCPEPSSPEPTSTPTPTPTPTPAQEGSSGGGSSSENCSSLSSNLYCNSNCPSGLRYRSLGKAGCTDSYCCAKAYTPSGGVDCGAYKWCKHWGRCLQEGETCPSNSIDDGGTPPPEAGGGTRGGGGVTPTPTPTPIPAPLEAWAREQVCNKHVSSGGYDYVRIDSDCDSGDFVGYKGTAPYTYGTSYSVSCCKSSTTGGLLPDGSDCTVSSDCQSNYCLNSICFSQATKQHVENVGSGCAERFSRTACTTKELSSTIITENGRTTWVYCCEKVGTSGTGPSSTLDCNDPRDNGCQCSYGWQCKSGICDVDGTIFLPNKCISASQLPSSPLDIVLCDKSKFPQGLGKNCECDPSSGTRGGCAEGLKCSRGDEAVDVIDPDFPLIGPITEAVLPYKCMKAALEMAINPALANGNVETESMDVQIVEINNKKYLAFEEGGVYIFVYEDEYYMVEVPNGQSAYKIFADKNRNGQKDENESYIEEADNKAQQIKVERIVSPQAYKIKPGYNFTAFPFVTTKLDAAQVLGDLRTFSGDITLIARYDSGTNRFYTVDARGSGGNEEYVYTNGDPFMIVPGQGYVIRNLSGKTQEISINGHKLLQSVAVDLNSGWNLVGVFSQNKKDYTASSLIDAVNGTSGFKGQAVNVTRWENNLYQGLQKEEAKEYGFDFPISDKKAYFVKVTGNCGRSGCGLWTP